MRTKILPAAAVTLVLGASTLQAHHSGYVYQREPSWISGTVTAFERLDPHTLIRLEERRDDGTVRPNQLLAVGEPEVAASGDRSTVSDVAHQGCQATHEDGVGSERSELVLGSQHDRWHRAEHGAQ